MELLQEVGIALNEWVFVDATNLLLKHEQCLRFFTNYLPENDNEQEGSKFQDNYRLLYYFSGNLGGCSGDDSLTTVLSTGNIPFYFNNVHPTKRSILRDFSKKYETKFPTLAQFVTLCEKDIKYEYATGKYNSTSFMNHASSAFSKNEAIFIWKE